MTDVIVDPVRALEAALLDMPEQQLDLDKITSHHFCDGMYARELFIPAGTVVIGKTHATQNFFVLLKGTLTLATPDGPRLITAPYMTTTRPGEKRAGYAHEDCIVMNFHPNADDEKDLALLEARYIKAEALPAPERELIA